ncbi:unnamed protein product [Polarella glacialis]|uniref:Histone-glutamine methyltransferase n=1 Tax=Polarella glacialis TaxID=89957 RepID=A0A813HMB4_POLGL|nr:unnamed protein product [Polarella glacialis]
MGKGGKDKGGFGGGKGKDFGKGKDGKGKKGKGKDGKGKKGKDGKGKGKGKGASQVIIEPHRHEGVFVSKGKDDSLVTRNLVPGESVYGEKRLVAESADKEDKIEYRVWNPFRSKLGAAIVGGIGQMSLELQESFLGADFVTTLL